MSQNEFSSCFAERLKELRKGKGLLLVKLSKELKENYGINVSKDSLINIGKNRNKKP